jgi:large subunit ribosomal protein L21
MYAIIESGGKQYRVEENQLLQVDKLALAEGSAFETDRVLLVAGEGEVKVGQPFVAGARVTGSVVRHEKGRKIHVFKYKPKKNYRRRKGHRQDYTRVRIDSIQV